MIYGIDANRNGEDVSEQFLERGIAGVGWRREDNPSVHQLLTRMQVGDVIYIKSYPPDEGLIIKGVGFLRTSAIFADEELGGTFRRVAWFWRGYEHISVIGDCHNGRRHNALYEELDPEVQLRVLALLVHAARVKPMQRSRLFCRAGLNLTRPDAESVKASPLLLQTQAREGRRRKCALNSSFSEHRSVSKC